MENVEQIVPVVEPPVASPKPLPALLILFAFLLTAGVFGCVGYFLGQRSVGSPAPIASSLPTPVPTSTPKNLAKYTSVSFPECVTTFSIPERSSLGNEPYWQAPRGTTYPNLLGLINPEVAQNNAKQFVAMYTTDEAASGQVDAAVAVSCVNFRMNITMNSEIINALTRGVEAYNQKTSDKGMGPESYSLTHSTQTKWGRDVEMVELNNDVYYTFIGAGFSGVYEVRAFGSSTDPKVLEERQRILDTLSFE